MTEMLVLPWPPSVNAMYRVFRNRSILSKAGRDFRNAAVAAIKAQGADLVACRCAVDILLYPPCRRRRDVDNYGKGVLDALVHGGALADDSLIDLLSIRRMGRKEGGEVWVRITELVTDEREFPTVEDER